MMTYEITKVTGEPAWDKIPTLEIANKYYDTPAESRAWAQIAYDDERFYVHLRTEEPETQAKELPPFGSPCLDSCLEFFFCPMEGDDRYFNIEYNACGCVYFGMGDSIKTLLRLIPNADKSAKSIFEPQISVYAGGWEIFYTIPYEVIRRIFPQFEVHAGKVLRANCYKCAEGVTPQHFHAWSPIVGEPFRFHRPECFGEMILKG